MIHELKCWPDFFQAMVDGLKTFEARKDDRGFQMGHILHLREWNPETETYTGREGWATVKYILRGPGWGVEAGYVVMSLGPAPGTTLKYTGQIKKSD